MTEKELKELLQQAENRGIKIMQEKLLFAHENGNPIDIDGRAYYVELKTDIENLREIFADIEADAE